MTLIDVLKRDIAGRKGRTDPASKRLEKRWHRELAQAQAAAGHVDHTRPIPRDGIDWAWGHAIPAQLRHAGVTFAVRYLGGSASKDLTRNEAENLSHAGIDIAVVYESTADRALGGYGAGAADARRAAAQAKAIGQPHQRPIYFAVDFDAAGAGQLAPVLEYLRGAVHAIGWERVGVYGGLGVIDAAYHEHRCKFLWQTLAWSAGRWSPHAQLRQFSVSRRVAGLDCDLDRAVAHDFGQWRV